MNNVETLLADSQVTGKTESKNCLEEHIRVKESFLSTDGPL